MAPAGRREARERALGLLYEAESKGAPAEALLAELPVAADSYAADLVRGVGRERDRIDELLTRRSIDWSVERMPVVDRALLRIGTYELLERPDVPTAVVLSEAVELAQRYSTEGSGRFVNGVLSALVAEARPAEGPAAGDAAPEPAADGG
jgi:transcription antitermination protein NusB